MPEAKKKTTTQLLMAAVIAAGLVAVAALQGIPLLTAALVLLPVASAMLAVTHGRVLCSALCAFAAVACVIVLPVQALPVALPWCLMSAVIACVPLPAKKPFLRPLMWIAMCLVTWAVGIRMVLEVTEGQTVAGLAQMICDVIAAHPEGDTILLNGYSMGLCRLKGTEALVPAIRAMGYVMIEENTRLQLLYSLRVSLEEMLPGALCDGVVFHAGLTALACTVLPDWMRRKAGEKGELPPMEKWYMPRGMGIAVASLCLGWLVARMSAGVMNYMGLLCVAVFRAAYTLQGICLFLWLEKKMGIRSVIRNLWAVALSVLAPIVPIVMGMVDQRRDMRHLRPEEEVESL